jgi:anaerobic magnesium-protoporphyrin IX monomethyl ester cyclase
MGIDAVIIADVGTASLSGSNPLRLEIEGQPATLSVVQSYLKNNGRIVDSVGVEDRASWSSAPRLNGLHLLSYLVNKGFEAELIDRYYQETGLFRRALGKGPRAIVVSTTFIINKQTLRDLTTDLRQAAPGAFIVVGGPFVYSSYMLLARMGEPDYPTELAKEDFLFLEVKDEPDVDLYIVSQQGEDVLVDVLNRLKNGVSLENIPNTAFLNDSYAFGPRKDEARGGDIIIDWASPSLPDSVFQKDVVPVQASVGCLHRCAFCNFIKDRSLAFVKPLDRLVTELKQVSRRGARYVRFVDDNFRLGSKDLNEVCLRLIAEGIDLKWMTFIRASTLARADLGLLRNAGCIEVQLGLESAHPLVLKNMNKAADAGLYARVVRDCLSAGINCSCCFVFGFPGETKETVETTIQFIKDSAHPDLEGTFSWSIYPFMVAPLSPIYEPAMRERYGLSGYMKEWSHSTMDWKSARAWITQAFLGIDNSGSHYGEENLDAFFRLLPSKRKEFSICRHRMSKLSLLGTLDRETMIAAFQSVLSRADK